MNCTEPVSYTHLDVYKRQTYHIMGTHASYYGIFFITVPSPCTFQFVIFQLPCIYSHQFVSATTCQYIRSLAVQIGHSYLVTVLPDQISIPVIPFRPVHAGKDVYKRQHCEWWYRCGIPIRGNLTNRQRIYNSHRVDRRSKEPLILHNILRVSRYY